MFQSPPGSERSSQGEIQSGKQCGPRLAGPGVITPLQDSGAQSQIRPRHCSRPAGHTVHTNILFHIFHVNCIVRLWEVLCIISTKFEGDFLHGKLMLEEVLGEAFFYDYYLIALLFLVFYRDDVL